METNDSSNKSNVTELVSARGTGEGLILRLLATAEWEDLLGAITDYLEDRKGFVSGNNVILEWIGGIPSDDLNTKVSELLQDKFKIKATSRAGSIDDDFNNLEAFSDSSSSESDSNNHDDDIGRGGYSGLQITRTSAIDLSGDLSGELSGDTGSKANHKSSYQEEERGLLKGVDSLKDSLKDNIEQGFEDSSNASSVTKGSFDMDFSSNSGTSSSSNSSFANSMFWDNPDAMIVHATLRSGQRIETEHSIVLIGDVNFGAEIVAGGDIIVLGILRGVVHAGAYDENGGGRFIFSLNLQPTQLRIGAVISRGGETKRKSKGAEVAYVDDGSSIVVEEYNSRNASSRIR